MQEELYTIDVRDGKILLGGANNTCTVMDQETGSILAMVEDYSDSVIFAQFIDSDKFISASLDGAISLMTAEQEMETVSVDGDISRIRISGDKLLVGTSKGNAYVFALDLGVQHVYMGQPGEILDLEYDCNRVYTLSATNYIIFDALRYNIMLNQHVKRGNAFDKIPGSDVVCYGSENRVVIRKNHELMSCIELDGEPECILYMSDYFVVGGDFGYLMLINMPMGMRVFKIPLEMDGITSIVGDGANKIAFSTLCDRCGYGDIRDDGGFRLVDACVGTIFSIKLADGSVYAAGQSGFTMIKIELFSS
jgi:hypothetical protein